MVTKEIVVSAFKSLGIKETDSILIHSSMKSFGYVEGGAQTIIDGLKEVVCKGNLCFPALRTEKIYDAYRDWDINNTPSGVGLLSETFRTSEGVLRSDQETHSVTAFGKDAVYITSGHRTGEPRYCVYGEMCFGYNSPWQRLYELDAKVVMIGVSMMYNTFKHFVETLVVNDVMLSLSKQDYISAEKEMTHLTWLPPHLRKKPTEYTKSGKPLGVWLWLDGEQTQLEMQKLNKLKFGKCGMADLICFNVKEFVDLMYNELRYNPRKWLEEPYYKWLEKYDTHKEN